MTPTPDNYEPPKVKTLGRVAELTLTDKKLGGSDGLTLLGVPITNTSP